MKKLISIVLLAALLLCGCTGKGANAPGDSATVEMSLEDIMDGIYAAHPVELNVPTQSLDLTNEWIPSSFLGLETADGITEAIASEPMMGSQAYSLVLCRVADSAKTADTASQMLHGIDTRKWICVEADDLQVVYYGDVIMLIMVSSDLADVATSQEMVDAFSSVLGQSVTSAT